LEGKFQYLETHSIKGSILITNLFKGNTMVDLAKIHGAAMTDSKVAIRACFDDDARGDPKEAAKILSLFEEIYKKNKKSGRCF
jgi:hypothetical protein